MDKMACQGEIMADYMEIEELRIPVLQQRGRRKTLSISITPQGELLVKAPLTMPERTIERFLNQKRYWIYKQAKRMQEESRNRVTRSEDEVKQLKQQARSLLTKRTEYYKAILGVEYARIRIGDQKTRWGSCSSRRTISYNWHLVLMPQEIQDYVVVHELCHLIEMNHSKAFWDKVGEVLPDYQKRRAWLKENGGRYI